MQDRCGAATCPSRMISNTVSSVPCWVEPPAPKVTEKYLGPSSASLARVARSFSAPSGVLGGKNSMLKLCGFIYLQPEAGHLHQLLRALSSSVDKAHDTIL